MICRAGGAGLMVASCLAAHAGIGGAAAALVYFAAALAGIVLVVNGQHVLTVLRAERRGHALTARAVHDGRVRRRASRPGQERR